MSTLEGLHGSCRQSFKAVTHAKAGARVTTMFFMTIYIETHHV